MKKNKGFVFMETIVVVSVLSLTLLLLFSSYSYILRKSRERNTFDTTETLYKTYYTKTLIEEIAKKNNVSGGVAGYARYSGDCLKMKYEGVKEYNSYVCTPEKNGDLNQAVIAFEIEKFYLVNPSELFSSSDKDNWLYLFDATTIDYLNEIGGNRNANLFIVKYKKCYDEETNINNLSECSDYEIIHSSLEVK